MAPAVSVIVTVYNTAPYLERCLDSLLAQSLEDLEIIVIDDASTDGSRDIAERYAEMDTRIHCIPLPENSPGGTGIPSNIGIRQARGRYVGFTDGDDWVESELFETLYRAAEESEADFSLCDFYTAPEGGEPIAAYDRHHWSGLALSAPVDLDEESRRALLLLSPVPWRKLYRRDFLLRQQLFFPEGEFFFEDTPFHFFTVLAARRVILVDKPLYYHRLFRTGQSMEGGGTKFLAFIAHFGFMADFITSRGLWDQHGIDFIIMMLNNAYWVWDRLDRKERKAFFLDCNRLLHAHPSEKKRRKRFLRRDQRIAFYIVYKNMIKVFSIYITLRKKGVDVYKKIMG